MGITSAAWAAPPSWQAHWEAFKSGFIVDEGRVVDWQENARTVSEGQAYALFFALVAGDRDTFRSVRSWTRDNLANGDLTGHSPAWLWGHHPDADTWGVLDANSATDADMFLAYALMEAGRLWDDKSLRQEGEAMLERIESLLIRREGDTPVLLPGLNGFIVKEGTRTNPSYLPPFQLRFFANSSANPFWRELLNERLQLLRQAAPRALPPDWVLATSRGYRPDSQQGTLGSYDAIRVFLWEAMEPRLDRKHPLFAARDRIVAIGFVPENWDVATGWHTGEGPPGFQVSFALFAEASGAPSLATSLNERVSARWKGGLLGSPARYYDQVLSLFAKGYHDRRFRFDTQGRLLLNRTKNP